jgi:hypothetical protein
MQVRQADWDLISSLEKDANNAADAAAKAQVCCRMLTYAHVCSRMLTYAGVCWRMLAYLYKGANNAADAAAKAQVGQDI